MSPDAAELRALLDFAVGLARDAGAITYRHFKGSFVAERKADNSFVTVADRETERYLRASIEKAFPTTLFLVKKKARSRADQIVAGSWTLSMVPIHSSMECHCTEY